MHLKCYIEVYDDIKCSRAMSQLHFGGHGVIFGHIWAKLGLPIDEHFIKNVITTVNYVSSKV